MLNDDQLDTAMDASPAPRVTKEYMESRITEKTFTRFSDTVTICQITLDNAFNKLWPLFGFLLAEKNKEAA